MGVLRGADATLRLLWDLGSEVHEIGEVVDSRGLLRLALYVKGDRATSLLRHRPFRLLG